MPTYEYACQECGEHLEVVQSFKDAPLEACGKCGGRLRKVFSAAGIIFKGSGYYVTDSRKKPADGGSSSTSTGSGSGSGSKSDSAKADTPKPDTPKSDGPKPAPKAESA